MSKARSAKRFSHTLTLADTSIPAGVANSKKATENTAANTLRMNAPDSQGETATNRSFYN